ncbi:glycosyltransferase family 39 protein [Candidatus Daviesbacteria bacterium]|nr:glycosyltransferase family 39 protein [Candidatus Daviesbacteria bacterium]
MFGKQAKLASGNLALVIILFLAALVRFYGLFPNTLLHPDEPHLLASGQKIAKNVLTNFDFSADVSQYPYKYGSSMYYLHGALQTGALLGIYALHSLLPHLLENFPQKSDLLTFLTDTGLYNYQNLLLTESRLVTALFGIGTVLLTFLIGRRLFGYPVGILAALILTFAPLHVRDSHYATVDIPQLFFILLSVFWLIKVFQTGKTRFYLLAGLTIGFATSLKYFPIAVLLYPLAHFLGAGRQKLLDQKFWLGWAMMPIGFLVSSPTLPFHFGDFLNTLIISSQWYAPGVVSAKIHWWQFFIPPYVHPFHWSFVFFIGFGVMPTLLAIWGFIIAWKQHPRPMLFLSVVPVVNFIFITFYLKEIYERLSLPSLPFLALFAGYGLWQLVRCVKPDKLKAVVLTMTLGVVLFYPAQESISASWACSQEITDYQARDWIKDNIAPGSTFGFSPGMRIPETGTKPVRMDVTSMFSWPEAEEAGVNLVFFNSGYYNYYQYWALDYFSRPEDLLANSFVGAALRQYQTQSQLVKKFVKPYTCMGNDIYAYRLAKLLQPGSRHLIYQDSWEKSSQEWRLVEFPVFGQQQALLSTNSNDLVFTWQRGADKMWEKNSYPTPRAVVGPFPVTPGKMYFLQARLSSGKEIPKEKRDGFFRIDFYKQRSIGNKPGFDVALSGRYWGQGEKTVQTQAVAPPGAVFATLSFQTTMVEEKGDFRISQVQFFQMED